VILIMSVIIVKRQCGITLRAVLRRTAQHRAENSKRERLQRQNAAQYCADYANYVAHE